MDSGSRPCSPTYRCIQVRTEVLAYVREYVHDCVHCGLDVEIFKGDFFVDSILRQPFLSAPSAILAIPLFPDRFQSNRQPVVPPEGILYSDSISMGYSDATGL